MREVGEQLVANGHTVSLPIAAEDNAYGKGDTADSLLKKHYIDEHFAKINASDAVLIVNEEKNGIAGYVGGNTLIEMALAYSQGLEVFLLNAVPEVSYATEIRGFQPIVLNGDLSTLFRYVDQLPLVFMSTTSPVKHQAISRAMRRAGIPVRVEGAKVESGVSEQPLTMNETYQGALSRHALLIARNDDADYFATVESGLHTIHDNHSPFGCNTLIIQKRDGEPHIGMDIDIEFPQVLLDRVPSEYPDLGVLVQEEFGSLLKDPYPYLTGDRLTRSSILEDAFFKIAIRLKEGVKA